MIRLTAAVSGVVCLLGMAACDGTYTPSAHHQEAVSTGSMLSGADTGVKANGSTANPSINSNFNGGAPGAH